MNKNDLDRAEQTLQRAQKMAQEWAAQGLWLRPHEITVGDMTRRLRTAIDAQTVLRTTSGKTGDGLPPHKPQDTSYGTQTGDAPDYEYDQDNRARALLAAYPRWLVVTYFFLERVLPPVIVALLIVWPVPATIILWGLQAWGGGIALMLIWWIAAVVIYGVGCVVYLIAEWLIDQWREVDESLPRRKKLEIADE